MPLYSKESSSCCRGWCSNRVEPEVHLYLQLVRAAGHSASDDYPLQEVIHRVAPDVIARPEWRTAGRSSTSVSV